MWSYFSLPDQHDYNTTSVRIQGNLDSQHLIVKLLPPNIYFSNNIFHFYRPDTTHSLCDFCEQSRTSVDQISQSASVFQEQQHVCDRCVNISIISSVIGPLLVLFFFFFSHASSHIKDAAIVWHFLKTYSLLRLQNKLNSLLPVEFAAKNNEQLKFNWKYFVIHRKHQVFQSLA